MEVGQRDRGRRSSLSQINVTPFVDVMLVLLIIFMVTAPMMEQGLEVDLPEVVESNTLEKGKEPVIVTVQKNGNISIGKSRVKSAEKLVPVLMQILGERRDKSVMIEADREVPYGEVVRVMAAIQGAGVRKIGMVTRQPEP